MKYGICAIIKNENLFLEEWIKWNLSIGFTNIYLYEDINSKSHKNITDKFENVYLYSINDIHENLIEDTSVTKFKGCYRQMVLYNWFKNNNPFNLDWCAFIDVDEYIRFDVDYNLEKLCNEFNDKGGFYLKWKMYGANQHIKRPTGSITNAYTKLSTKPPCQGEIVFKSVINMHLINGNWISMHEIPNLYNTLGFQSSRVRTYKKAWIDHYITKSWEDWCMRFIERGENKWGCRVLDEFFEHNEDMLSQKKELYEFYNNLKNNYLNNTI